MTDDEITELVERACSGGVVAAGKVLGNIGIRLLQACPDDESRAAVLEAMQQTVQAGYERARVAA